MIIVLTDIFTIDEIDTAFDLFFRGERTAIVAEKVVAPVLSRIEAEVGQKCEPLYLAYMLEWAYLRTIQY